METRTLSNRISFSRLSPHCSSYFNDSPYSVIALCATRLMIFTPLMQQHPFLLYCISLPTLSFLVFCGLTNSFLSKHVNVYHLCRRHMDWKFVGLFNIVILTLNSYLHVVNQEMLLVVCFVGLLIVYAWFVFTIIEEIKSHLGIYALHLTPKKDSCVCCETALL